MKNLFRLSAILLLTIHAAQAESPNVPVPLPEAYGSESPASNKSRFWTPANTALVATDAVAKSFDMWNTMWNASRSNFSEHDPLARPFVHSGPGVAGASQGAVFAAEVFASYLLHKHGHGAWAKSVLVAGTGGNLIGIATSTR